MMNRRGIGRQVGLIGIVALGSVTAVLLAGCGSHEETHQKSVREALPTVNVTTQTASGDSVVSTISITGAVRAKDRASVATKVMGTVRELPVVLGQSVKEGDLLVKVEAAEIKAKVLQAEAQLKQAKRDLEREKSLLDKGASTPEIVKNLTDRVAITEAMVEEAQVMRGYTEILAPFDGTVAKKYIDVGSLASPGMPLLEIVGAGSYEIEAGVPESLVNSLKIGARVPAHIPSNNESFEVTLAEFSSSADSYSRTVTARFTIPEDVVARAGQFATISLGGESFDAIFVPVSSVSKVGQMERVFVVEDGLAHMRLVKTGDMQGEFVEILSGIDPGEAVVSSAQGRLLDRQPVQVVRN